MIKIMQILAIRQHGRFPSPESDHEQFREGKGINPFQRVISGSYPRALEMYLLMY